MDWTERAACRGADPDLWFTADTAAEAIAICNGCPVRQPCGEEAIRDGHVDGIWGGMTYQDRRRAGMRPHGNLEGYINHRCRCDRCRQAAHAYFQDRRRPVVGT